LEVKKGCSFDNTFHYKKNKAPFLLLYEEMGLFCFAALNLNLELKKKLAALLSAIQTHKLGSIPLNRLIHLK